MSQKPYSLIMILGHRLTSLSSANQQANHFKFLELMALLFYCGIMTKSIRVLVLEPKPKTASALLLALWEFCHGAEIRAPDFTVVSSKNAAETILHGQLVFDYNIIFINVDNDHWQLLPVLLGLGVDPKCIVVVGRSTRRLNHAESLGVVHFLRPVSRTVDRFIDRAVEMIGIIVEGAPTEA